MLNRINVFLLAVAIALGIALATTALAPPPAITREQTAYREYCAQTKNCDAHQAKSLWIPEDATGFFTLWIALFTAVLAVSTLFLWDATKESADAAKLNAEALIAAERAHLFVIIRNSNAHEALRGARFYGGPQSASMHDAQIPRPELEFVIRNTGRTAAILRNISYQLIQADAATTEWRYAFQDTIVNPTIEGGQETAPPTPCVTENAMTIRDGIAAVDEERPLFLYGFVTFTDTFKRDYQYFWRYQYRGNRFVLVHEEEQHPPSIH